MPQKGGVRIGSGSYGTVFAEPALPAIDEDGNHPPRPLGEYCSKVFIWQDDPPCTFYDDANEQATNENAVRQFLIETFGPRFNLLAGCIVIPAGDYYIDGDVLAAEGDTYYTNQWLAPRDNAQQPPGAGAFLREAQDDTNADGIKKVWKQVLMEQGGPNLFEVFYPPGLGQLPSMDINGLRDRVSHTINILRGVRLLQTRDMIHGDLKSRNCVRMMDGIFKIIDVADVKTISSLLTAPSEEGIVPIMAQVFSYSIWPATVCAFAARGLPAAGGGTEGEELTRAQFQENWTARQRRNQRFGPNDNVQMADQKNSITIVQRLVTQTNSADKVLGTAFAPFAQLAMHVVGGGGGGGGAEEGIMDNINITGNMLIENLKRTYMINPGGIYRESPDIVYDNNKGWNDTPIIELFKRIDIFSFGIMLLQAINNGPPIAANQDYYRNILKLFAQCCYEDPDHVMNIDEDVITALSAPLAPPAALAPPAGAAAAAAAAPPAPPPPRAHAAAAPASSWWQVAGAARAAAGQRARAPTMPTLPLWAREGNHGGKRTRRKKRRKKKTRRR